MNIDPIKQEAGAYQQGSASQCKAQQHQMMRESSPHYNNQQDTKVPNNRDRKLVVGVIDCIRSWKRKKYCLLYVQV